MPGNAPLWVKVVYKTVQANKEVEEFVAFFGDDVLVSFFGKQFCCCEGVHVPFQLGIVQVCIVHDACLGFRLLAILEYFCGNVEASSASGFRVIFFVS